MPVHQLIEQSENIAKIRFFSFFSFRSGLSIKKINYKQMKTIIAALILLSFLSGCSSMSAGQKKMNAYNMHMNDHPDRNLAQIKKMRRR
ncbi:hypothetical protein MNBD_GAMMA03-125 [hydrothermal vent metagenome]|uniref:Uncharacterized protein n=1 Tax=hydrothermal vent metagenome TaxID=652676 RepID=A0A3B0WQ09_9ZZZZ